MAGTERWMRIGRSRETDAVRAGAEAADMALGADEAKLLVVFCSDAYDLQALLDSINGRSGGMPLIGCSTAGEIATDGPSDASVVVVAFGGDDFRAQTVAAEQASSRLREAGAEVAAAMTDLEPLPHRVLLLLTDGLAGDQQEVVRGAYSVLGAAIPLVGGCAGDGLKMRATYQFCDDRVLTDSVVGAALGSPAMLGIGVRHGWRKVGEPMVVTRSAGNVVYSLGDEPALDVYLDRLDAPPAARSDPEAFTAFALTHPLGIERRRGEEHVRFVAEADFDARALGCIAEVPQGGMAWFMDGDAESVLEATDAACHDALLPLEGRPPIGLIAFDCIARRGVLGDGGIAHEIERIAKYAGGAPVAGFYTYGEIARTQGIRGFHNQTLVVLAVE